jgi:hypothetical protein
VADIAHEVIYRLKEENGTKHQMAVFIEADGIAGYTALSQFDLAKCFVCFMSYEMNSNWPRGPGYQRNSTEFLKMKSGWHQIP